MASEAGATANPEISAMPIIASSNRGLDIAPYCHHLFSQELDKFIAILPSEFPQGDRKREEAFLRQFFSDSEIQVQGGAEGEGSGFRFLKEAWLWAAHWNINCRVPALAAWWIEHNQSILNDPDMKKRIFEPHVQPSTFFESKEISMYGDKLLRIVIKHIQHELRRPVTLLADGSPSVASYSGLNDPVSTKISTSTSSSHRSAKGNIQQPADKIAAAVQVTEAMAASKARPGAVSPQDRVQTQVQQTHPELNDKAQPHHNDEVHNGHRGRFNTRGSRGHTSQKSNGNRGARAGSKAMYGRQDARYQSPLLSSSTMEFYGGAMPAAGVPIQPDTGAAGSCAPGLPGYPPPMHAGPHFLGQHQMMPSMNGFPTPYGYPVQGNLQAQFYQHAEQVSTPPGFAAHHAQPFGDRSNFPNDGRNVSNESRLFNPDEKNKRPKQGSYGGATRNHKQRGQPYSQRGGNRGHSSFGQTGWNFARDGSTFHRHSGSDFHAAAGSGPAHQDQSFSFPPQDRPWQHPYPADSSAVAAQNYTSSPQMFNNALSSVPDTHSGIPPHPNDGSGSPPSTQYPPTGHGGGHQRGLSKSTPCNPTECNKYSIGEECTYARKLVIFQVPYDMTSSSFANYFASFGQVENVFLSNNQDESQSYPGLLQRGICWVLFVHADSAREVLHRRGKPWAGGPMLFAEVAGEYWDLENRLYHPHRPVPGSSVPHNAASTSRTPPARDSTPGNNMPSSEANLAASGNHFQKKKITNNKKPKKNKKPAPGDGATDADLKGGASRQNPRQKRMSSTDEVSEPKLDPAVSVVEKPACEELASAVAVKPAATLSGSEDGPVGEFELVTDSKMMMVNTDGLDKAINLDTSQFAGITTSSAAVDVTSLSPTAENPELNTSAIVAATDPITSAKQATMKLSDDQIGQVTAESCDEQVDDSFHTADGSHGEKKAMTALDDGVDASVAYQAPPTQEECVKLPIGESAMIAPDIKSSEPIKVVETPAIKLATAVDSLVSPGHECEASVTTLGSLKETQSAAFVGDATMITEDAVATNPGRSVTITVPRIDTRIVAVGDTEDQNSTLSNAQLRAISDNSISGAPSSAFVTAPSTPAIPGPNLEIQSKKPLKLKGPAQTESLSLFAKPKSRKPSSKKAKHSVEPSSRPGSVNSVQSSGQADTPLVPHAPNVHQFGLPAGDKKADGANTVKSSDAGGPVEGQRPSKSLSESISTSESSSELPSTKAWSVTNLVEPVRAFLSMNSAPQDMKTDGSLPYDDSQRIATEKPTIQSVDYEGGASLSKELPDSQGLPEVGYAAGHGTSEGTAISSSGNATERTPSPSADESKPKKKKAKSKGKTKKTKAVADVTILGDTLTHPKPSEPIHEFRGNDVTSDSSSQTLGRTSPASKRPSMKRIDEAKQPKPLLEPRPARQIRNKKHTSVHINKTEGTNSIEDIAVRTQPDRTVILAPCGDGTYLSGAVEAKEVSTPNQLMLMPTPTPESDRLRGKSPTPEKPWEVVDGAISETPSPEAAKSKERLHQLKLEEAQKKKFA